VGTPSALPPLKRLFARDVLRVWLPPVALGAIALAAALAGQVAATTALASAALVATLITTGALRERDALHPAVVVAGFLGVLTVGRALYVLDREAFGLRLADQLPLAGNERSFALGVFAQLAGAAVFAAGASWTARRARPARPEGGPIDLLPLSLAIAAVALASAISVALLVRETGGLGDYIDALGFRQVLFDDRGFALIFSTMLPGLVLAWLAVNIGRLDSGNRRTAALLLFGLGGLAAMSTGTRSLFVFFLLLPAIVLFHIRVRRIPMWIALVIGVVVLGAAGAYRERLRDEGSQTAGGIYQDGPKGYVVNTFASPDAHQPDPVAMLVKRSAGPKLGTTIAAAVLTPVPRRIWAGKPTGANQQFTELESPEQFEGTKTEYAITFAGELYWNFWWPGLAAFALVGLAVGAAYRNALDRPRDPLSLLGYAGALGTALLLVRTDTYITIIVAAQVFVPALALLWIGRRMAASR
jgi:hypothetical protein